MIASSPTAKAYSYLRFSTPEQMKGDSFRRQTQLAVDYCAKNGLTLDTEVTWHDLGVSAFRGKNAEAGRLHEFLEAVREGIVKTGSYLLVESLDRISRQAARKALRTLEAICDEGITVVTLSDGKAYNREALDADPMALIMSLLVFIRANEESAMKSKRLRAAWTGKRDKALSKGHKLTSTCPGWLKLDKEAQTFTVIEERAEVVRRIYRMYSEGIGIDTICKTLTSEGVPTFGGGVHWSRPYLVILLDTKAVIGTYVPHTLEYVEGKRVRKPMAPIENYYPAIVDNELYQAAQSVRGGSRAPRKAAALHNIFGGLVRCGRCGSSMFIVGKGKGKQRYFVCVKARYGGGCKYTAVQYGRFEGLFLQAAPRILGEAPSGDSGALEQLRDIDAAMEALEDKRGTLTAGYEATGSLGLLERLKKVEAELEDLGDRREDLIAKVSATESGFVAKRVADLKERLSVGVQKLDRPATNSAIRALFSGLALDPDTGVATLGWRHGGVSTFEFAWPAVVD